MYGDGYWINNGSPAEYTVDESSQLPHHRGWVANSMNLRSLINLWVPLRFGSVSGSYGPVLGSFCTSLPLPFDDLRWSGVAIVLL